jgi:hypothetical protein
VTGDLSVNGTATLGGALTVTGAVTLGGEMTVTGAATFGGTLTGTTGSKIVVGTSVTGGTFYNAGETVMDDADVKGTYNWVTDANGTGTAGWQEAFTDLAAAEAGDNRITLKASDESADTSGLSLTYARKSTKNEIVYIKLGGDLLPAYVYETTTGGQNFVQPAGTDPGSAFAGDYWGGATSKPAAGKYAGVYIGNIFKYLFGSAVLTGKYIAVRQANQSLRFNTGAYGTIPGSLDGPAVTDDHTSIPTTLTDMPVKWKIYGEGAIAASETFGLLIWSGADPKTAEFDFDGRTSASDPSIDASVPSGKVIVDYSAVNFGS